MVKESLMHVESLLKQGQGASAKEQLLDIAPKNVSMTEMYKYVNLARRLRLPQLSLRILNPIVRGHSSDNYIQSLQPELVVEYAGSLFSVGAVNEGRSLLNVISNQWSKDAYLMMAFSYFSEWDYRSAIPLLEKYLGLVSDDDYWKVVGQVNLAAAYVVEELTEKADILLDDLKSYLEMKKKYLLLANCWELRGQNRFLAKEYGPAEIALNKSKSILGEHFKQGDLSYVEKWIEINRAHLLSDPTVLNEIRNKMIKRSSWENVRQIDYFYNSLSDNVDESMMDLYFRSPQKGFRRLLQEKFNVHPIHTDRMMPLDVYSLHENLTKKPCTVNMVEATINKNKDHFLKPGSNPYQLLLLLSSDGYTPFSSGRIFSHLYPGECFDPIHSPIRVAQVIKRLRNILKKNKMPLSIECKNNQFRILSQSRQLKLKIPLSLPELNRSDSLVLNFVKIRNIDLFSVADISAHFQISKRAGYNILNKAVEEGVVKKCRWGSQTKFRLIKSDELVA